MFFIILTLLFRHHEKTGPEGAIFTSDLICNAFHFLNAHIYERLKGGKKHQFILQFGTLKYEVTYIFRAN